MIGVVVAIVFLVGSLCLMIGGVLLNQINPGYNSALAVPVFNALGIILAILGLVISFVVKKKNRDIKLAKRTMVFGIVCVVLLLLLFPLSNIGTLSVFR